ncbi:NUDIX domain-containing protein [Labrys sp. LIt4]|uniref:NUDIX hydrolase n=1 Tax=Labrys okinawensis TaxID=346911 RepID=A0A2S9Q6N9_9HYPH|nr:MULTISPECIES: NUDIX domain-containing protein [Labrys]MBP0578841.1 NUDIX domain-containing protein [Labrys sp. LIt4]PRH84980.1 NUDIX hydrolase [Labrys okinawensis]
MTDIPVSQLKPRPVRPRDSASLILLDRAGKTPRILMGRRHSGHAFMPGVMVFPGGRVEAADRSMSAYGALAAHTERSLLTRVIRPSPAKARALALCAIRETFEETGILLGETGLGAPPTSSPHWRAFAEHEVFPSPEGLHFVARAITPPAMKRRFDTRFFVADARSIAHQTDGVVGPDSELIETKWLSFDEARAQDLVWITRTILEEVAKRLEIGLEKDVPVPFYREQRGVRSREEI